METNQFNIKKEKELINFIFNSFSESQKKEWYLQIIKSPESFIYDLWEGSFVKPSLQNGKNQDVKILSKVKIENLFPKDLILRFFDLENNKKSATEIYISEIRNNLIKKYKNEELETIKEPQLLKEYNDFYNKSVIFLKNNKK